jgi:hypothetical protein
MKKIKSKSKAEKLREKKERISFIKTMGVGEKTWETCDPPYTPFVRYCKLRKLINEIISTSEEDVNIPNDMIKILFFWSPNLEIDKQKKNKEPEMESLESILDTNINDEQSLNANVNYDHEVDQTTLAVFEMADWVRLAEMFKEYLRCEGDHYTLDRKVVIIDHYYTNPKLFPMNRNDKRRSEQKESGEDSDNQSDTDSPPSPDVYQSPVSSEQRTNLPLCNDVHKPDEWHVVTDPSIINRLNKRGESLAKFSENSEKNLQKFSTPIHQIKQLETLKELTHVSLKTFKGDLEHQKRNHAVVIRNDYITNEVKDNLDIKLAPLLLVGENWLDWEDEKFFEVLLKEFPKLDTHMTENIIADTTKRLEGIKLDIDYSKEMSEMKYINDINVILRETNIAEKANKEQMSVMIKLLIKNIENRQRDRPSDGEVYKQLTMYLRVLGRIETIKSLLIEISKWISIKRKVYNEAVLLFNLKKGGGNNQVHLNVAKAEPNRSGGVMLNQIEENEEQKCSRMFLLE